MNRIGDFADDDIMGFAVKSPELGAAMAAFSQAVYTKGRLPIRVREAARIVIAHANECVVCQNTRDSKGEAGGVDVVFLDEHELARRRLGLRLGISSLGEGGAAAGARAGRGAARTARPV